MARRNKGSSKGSSKEVKIIEDLGSAVVHELVEQLNEARIPIKANRVGGAAATYLVALGVWDVDMWIRSGSIVNRQNNALVAAGTDIFLKAAQVGELDFEGATLTGARTLFAAEGFDVGNFPAKSSKSTKDFATGVLGTAVSGSVEGLIVKAGEVLYLEFVNAEAGARYLDIFLYAAPTDYLNMAPRGLQSAPHLVQRDFQRSTRKNR